MIEIKDIVVGDYVACYVKQGSIMGATLNDIIIFLVKENHICKSKWYIIPAENRFKTGQLSIFTYELSLTASEMPKYVTPFKIYKNSESIIIDYPELLNISSLWNITPGS